MQDRGPCRPRDNPGGRRCGATGRPDPDIAGTYKEGVTVETEDLVIRGADRNDVIIDGEFTRENGFKILADGVAVENLTARNHTANGVFWTGSYEDDYVLKGYRASYITAYNNGLYGVYAFNAVERPDRAQLRLGPPRLGRSTSASASRATRSSAT